MKLQVKQLDETTSNTIAVALETYAASVTNIDKGCSTKYLELAVMFRHSIPLLVSESYDAPVDDVQVLGNEKGGHYGV